MSAPEQDRIWLNRAASDIAFRAGQLLETLLVDRGIEVCRSAGSRVVTAETINACIDSLLLEDLKKRVHERAEQESRRVA